MEKDIPQILLLSHGEMCLGMVDSARMLSGETDSIVPLPLREGDAAEDYLQKIREAYDAMPEGSIILVDIMGGTPANCVAMLARERKIYALAGISLGTLINAIFSRTICAGQQLIELLEEDTKNGVVNMSEIFSQIGGINE